jgi:excisionase family DNA binding protein
VPREFDGVVWLTTREAAERADVRVETLYRWIREGSLSFRRLRRGENRYIYLIREADLEEYLMSPPGEWR